MHVAMIRNSRVSTLPLYINLFKVFIPINRSRRGMPYPHLTLSFLGALIRHAEAFPSLVIVSREIVLIAASSRPSKDGEINIPSTLLISFDRDSHLLPCFPSLTLIFMEASHRSQHPETSCLIGFAPRHDGMMDLAAEPAHQGKGPAPFARHAQAGRARASLEAMNSPEGTSL
jgi:hypothetical protein